MPNPYFQFKQFLIRQDECAMKVGTDGVLLGAWANVEKVDRALDVGTGTGLIALMLAQRCNAEIDAIDLDEQAFRQAQKNIGSSSWKERIKLYHSSFQNFSELHKEKYDLIISNPPFFKKSFLPADHSRALARHDNSLSAKELILHVLFCLAPSGRFCVILPFENLNDFEYLLLEKSMFINRIMQIRPRPGKNYIRVLIEASRNLTTNERSELTIQKEKRHVYTDEYVRLTRDFYLNFT